MLLDNSKILKKRIDDEYMKNLGIKNRNIVRNLYYAEIYEAACQALKPANPDTKPTCISATGAMVAYSGDRTGRSPKDKRFVMDEITKDTIWWGDVNIPLE